SPSRQRNSRALRACPALPSTSYQAAQQATAPARVSLDVVHHIIGAIDAGDIPGSGERRARALRPGAPAPACVCRRRIPPPLARKEHRSSRPRNEKDPRSSSKEQAGHLGPAHPVRRLAYKVPATRRGTSESAARAARAACLAEPVSTRPLWGGQS